MEAPQVHAKRWRWAASIIAAVFAFFVLGLPMHVGAQFVPPVLITNPVLDPLEVKAIAEEEATDATGFQVSLAVTQLYQNLLQNILSQTATWIASGAEGQFPLFDRRTAGALWGDMLLGAGMELLEQFDNPVFKDTFAGDLAGAGDWVGLPTFSGLTQFLCAPNPQVALAIKLGVADSLRPKPPKCTWQQVKNGFDRLDDRQNLQQQLSDVGAAFEPGQSDLSVGLETQVSLSGTQSRADREFQKIIKDGGYLGTVETVSGLTKTPAEIVKDKVSMNYVLAPEEAAGEIAGYIKNDLNSIGTLGALLQSASIGLGVQFAQTLVSQLIQKQVLEKGIFLSELDFFKEPGRGSSSSSRSPASGRAEAARQVFGAFEKPRFKSTADYDILGLFSTCPNSESRTLDTCVLDTNFVSAVRAGRTVQEAMQENGGLFGSRRLAAAGSTVDQDASKCLNEYYCASNLAKMRLWRILPIGWELAANLTETTGPRTLQQVVDAFDASGGDGICDGRTESGSLQEDPFCGLIDPDWVLKYPEHQCRLEAPTEVLQGAGIATRASACRDAVSCVEQDANGVCTGAYGYCIAEKQVWRLNATTCPPQAASCQRFVDSGGSELALLTNTVERGICNAGNAGCLWYATTQAGAVWDATASAEKRRYFNGNVQSCSERSEGCTALIPLPAGSTAGQLSGPSVLLNGGFETDADGDNQPDGWELQGTESSWSNDGTKEAEGVAAVWVNYYDGTDYHGAQLVSRIPIAGGMTYTFTARAQRTSPDATGRPRVRLLLFDAAGEQTDVTSIATTGSCNLRDNNHPGGIGIYTHGKDTVLSGLFNEGYRTASCTFTAPATAVSMEVVLYGESGGAWFDALDFKPEIATAPRTNLKVAPAEYRCGNTDPSPRCSSFAPVCSAGDVGCTTYTPVARGYEAVNGTVTVQDQCSLQCVGYDAYREVESNFDVRDAFDYFIPSSARQCTAAEAGCSAFTNLDTAAAGGESRAYFTDLRACRKPTDTDASPATYYTWEGSEREGFQIREFRLQSSGDANSAPYMFDGSGSCQSEYGTDADCRRFYAQNGTTHYQHFSKTVVITDTCTRYRLGHELPNDGTETQQQICERKGGAWDTSAGCVFRGAPELSAQCAAAAVSCRAYRGNTSGAATQVFTKTFTVDGEGWTGGTRVPESLKVPGGSLRVGSGIAKYQPSTTLVGADAATCTELGGTFTPASGTTTPSACAISLLRSGTTYEISFIARGSGTVRVDMTSDGASASVLVAGSALPTVTVGPTWRRYTMGPILTQTSGVLTATTDVQLAVSGSQVYFDEITLRSAPQQTYVMKRSWQTPAQCDLASIVPGAAAEAQGMLGCRAYKNSAGTPEYIRSFSRLCAADVVGCTAFYDTRGTDTTDSVTYNSGNAAAVTVPADIVRYLVDKPAYRCEQSQTSCRRFGKPALDRIATTETVSSWSDVFLLDDPARYEGPSGSLCTEEALFCEAFGAAGGAVSYFKHPGDRTCGWRDGARMPNGTHMNGWFQKHATVPTPCYDGFVSGGDTYQIRRNSDTGYSGWAGTCKTEHDQCVELVDPSDVSTTYPQGRTYNVIRDNTLNLAGCAGAVNQKEGCVLLQESGRTTKTWSAPVSYAKAELSQIDRVPPVDCDRNPAECKRCVQQAHCETMDGLNMGVPCTLGSAGDTSCQGYDGSDSGTSPDAPLSLCVPGGQVGKQCTQNSECASSGPGPHGSEYTCQQFSNDANLLVAARPDRQCIMWYERDSGYDGRDADNNEIEASTSVFLTREDGRAVGRTPEYLTRSMYQQRDRFGNSVEYTGYAMPGRTGLEFLRQVRIPFGGVSDPEPVLVPVFCPVGVPGCHNAVPGYCVDGAADGAACGIAIGPSGSTTRGTCKQSFCVYPPSINLLDEGTYVSVNADLQYDRVCKAYPDDNAPFPNVIVRGILETADLRFHRYADVNTCADGAACECSYQKVVYDSGSTRYYGIERTDSDISICSGGGALDGKSCTIGVVPAKRDPSIPGGSCQVGDVASSSEDGRCVRVKEGGITPKLGLRGYCLEYDKSQKLYGEDGVHPCTTFYPVDQIVGEPALTVAKQEAEYQPSSPYMCLAARGNAYMGTKHPSVYPSEATATNYIVAARLEGTYTGGGSDDENAKMLFSNARASGRDVSLFEFHPVQGEPIASCDLTSGTLYESRFDDENFSESGTFIDRGATRVDSSGNISIASEASYWYPDGVIDTCSITYGGRFINKETRKINRNDIAAIYFDRKITDLDDNEGEFGGGDDMKSDFTLDSSNDWQICLQEGGPGSSPLPFTPKPGKDATDAWCWGDANDPVSTNRFDVRMSGTNDLNDQYCEEDRMYLGIVAEFNDKDELTGFRTGFCNDVDAGSTFAAYNIFFKSREWCTDIVQVARGTGAKPWTNRLWKEGWTTKRMKYGLNAPLQNPFGSSNRPAGSPPGNTMWNIGSQGVGGAPYGSTYSASVPYSGAPYACENGKCFRIIGTGSFIHSIANGLLELKEIYGSILGGWQWTAGGGGTASRYTPYNSYISDITGTPPSASAGDVSPFRGDTPTAPMVYGSPPVDVNGEVPAGTTVGSLTSGTFMVGGTNDGNVVGAGGQLRTDIRMFVKADENQMPIREITLQYGDGKDMQFSGGSYANHLPTCDGSTFGSDSATGCEEGPLVYHKTYVCYRNSLPNACNNERWKQESEWGAHPEWYSSGCYDNSYASPNSSLPGACIFRPRVQVKDNWGYCTGTCSGGVGGNKCYDDTSPTSECAITSNKPWVPFAGRIVVTPP